MHTQTQRRLPGGGKDWELGASRCKLFQIEWINNMVLLYSIPVIDLGPNYGGGNEDNGDLPQKIPCMHCYTQCPQPCSRPPSTHASVRAPGHSRASLVSLLWGHCSFLLGPGVHKVLFMPSQGLFPQSCVSSSSSVMGLMVTSSKRAYAIPRSTAPRAPASAAGHC